MKQILISLLFIVTQVIAVAPLANTGEREIKSAEDMPKLSSGHVPSYNKFFLAGGVTEIYKPLCHKGHTPHIVVEPTVEMLDGIKLHDNAEALQVWAAKSTRDTWTLNAATRPGAVSVPTNKIAVEVSCMDIGGI